MNSKLRFSLMTVVLLLTLIFSAAMTVPAYADDGAPPPDETPAVESAPVEDSAPAVESAPVEDSAPVVESAPAAESAPETVAEIIAQLPEGTEIVALDEAGEALPLVSEEAAAVITGGDPMWCPVGVAPKAGIGGCSGSFTGFKGLADNQLVNWLDTNDPSKAGVIWVAYNYSGWAEEGYIITLDGNDYANLDNYALTIQGGWDGTIPGSTALNANSPYSTFQVPLNIVNWTGAVTLKNINIDVYDSLLIPSNQALEITTAGAITLETVNVDNNINSGAIVFDGALLDNRASSLAAGITIKNSSFSDNEGFGLQAYSDGVITGVNLSANGNLAGTGAKLDNTSAATDKAVTLSGYQQFSNNLGGYGLHILSDGAITLANVVANNNSLYGALLNNTTSAGQLGVTLKGVNQFNGNANDGIDIRSKGAIAVSNITASNNLGWGLDFRNETSTLFKGITLTGNNIIYNNGGSGLYLYSKGAIVLNNISVTENNNAGAYINNQFSGSSAGVTINGYGNFSENGTYGLLIFSNGAILLNNISADNNGSYGALIDNCNLDTTTWTSCENPLASSAVTLNGANSFSDNSGYGLEVHSKGLISANNLNVNNNGYGNSYYWNGANWDYQVAGAWLNNKFGPGGITLKGTNNFNNNGFIDLVTPTNNIGAGLVVWSKNAVSVNNITADWNGEGGADFSLNSDAIVSAFTMTGINSFSHNRYGAGLQVVNNGAITVSNVTASWNGAGLAGNGAMLSNQTSSLSSNITLLGINNFSHNNWVGLLINSNGAVLTNNITANHNQQTGASIYNTAAPTPKAVTMNGTNNTFSDNVNTGFVIESDGIITLNNITANSNGGPNPYGVYIMNNFNAASAGSPGVILKGNNTFNQNLGGLLIASNGAISLNNVSASYNMGIYGMWLDNSGGLNKSITLTGINTFTNNVGTGLEIYSNGAVTLSRVTVNKNTNSGLYVIATGNITLTCGYAFGNPNSGIYLSSSAGSVTVKGIYTYGSGTNEAFSFNTTKSVIRPCALP